MFSLFYVLLFYAISAICLSAYIRPDRRPRHRSSDLRLRRSWSLAKRQPETVCSQLETTEAPSDRPIGLTVRGRRAHVRRVIERPPETIDQSRCLSVYWQRSTVRGHWQLDHSMTIAQLINQAADGHTRIVVPLPVKAEFNFYIAYRPGLWLKQNYVRGLCFFAAAIYEGNR